MQLVSQIDVRTPVRASSIFKNIDLNCFKKKLYCIVSLNDNTLIDTGSVDNMLETVTTLNLIEAGCVIVNHEVAMALLQRKK